MSKKFTKQQREVLARKLGYDGPMNMFDQFVKSDPAMERKYSTVVEKYMARGGMVKKYQEGGAVTTTATQQQQPTKYGNFDEFMQGLVQRDPELQALHSDFYLMRDVYPSLNQQVEQEAIAKEKAEFSDFYKQREQQELQRIANQDFASRAKEDLAKRQSITSATKPGDRFEYSPSKFYTMGYTMLPDGRARGDNDVIYSAAEIQQMLSDIDARLLAARRTSNELAPSKLKKENPELTNQVYQEYQTSVLEPFKQQRFKEIAPPLANPNLTFQQNRQAQIAAGEKYRPLRDVYEKLKQEQNSIEASIIPQIQALAEEEKLKNPQGDDAITAEYDKKIKALQNQAAAMKEASQRKLDYFLSSEYDFTKGPDQLTDVYKSAYDTALKRGPVAPTAAPTTQTAESTQTQAALSQPTTTTAPTTAGATTPTVGTTTPVTSPTTTTPTTTTPTVGATGTTPTTTAPVTGTTPTTTATTPGVTTGVTSTSTPALQTTTTTPSTGGMTGTQMAAFPTTSTVPKVNIPQVTAATVPTEPGQMVAPTGAPEQAAQIQGAVVPGVAQVTPTAPQAAATMQAATATGAVSGELAGLQPAQGAVSQQAQVQAATMEPTSSALAGLQAAQTTAGQVQGAPTRSLVAGELVEGPTVDRAAVEAALAKNEAAQGVVTEDMTVQGQLAKLTSNFEANNPPAWAAGALRNATAVMAQRGLAASSLAGQALIQATIESALPIASADAQIYREMGIQNLTNKQQMAVLSAQQRAAFLGQEFDQAFQTRVTNAATISEIANLNFSAKQQIALENARLAESVNLANLNNRQALVMANAAQIATLETANLNNRQQANVLNAQAFLQMDLTNLSNQQQTALFKSQSMIQSILSDQAAENAARQFNASSVNQVNQFYDGLTAQIKQFNATQANAMNQFNVSQINSVAEFNASQQNARDQFNAEYRRIIDQSNAEWRRNIALADTAAINRANEVNATAALGISTIEYNNLWQTYRDNIEYAWKTGENALDRENELARQILAKQATIEAAKFQIEAAKYQALGGLAAQVFDKGGIAAAIGGFLGTGTGAAGAGGFVAGAASGIRNLFTTGVNRNVQWNELTNADQNNPGAPAYGWKYYSDGVDTVAIDPNGSVYYNGNNVVDDQLAYTDYIGPPGYSQTDLYGYSGSNTRDEVDNYIFPTD